LGERTPSARIGLNGFYVEILEQTDLEALFSYSQDISGLFLPCPAKEFFDGKPRYIICGQETKGWRNSTCGLRNKRLVSDEDVTASMQQAEAFGSYGAKRSKFMQFYRSAALRLRPDALAAALWSNQFWVGKPSRSATRDLSDAERDFLLSTKGAVRDPPA